jgi:hypothetical protein
VGNRANGDPFLFHNPLNYLHAGQSAPKPASKAVAANSNVSAT